MAALSAITKAKCEKLFDMEGGYVLDFSTASFDTFIADKIGVDTTIGDYRPLSKAKKLRLLWRNEPDNKIGKLILDLCEHAEAMYYTHGRLDDEKRGTLSDLRVDGQRLMGQDIALELLLNCLKSKKIPSNRCKKTSKCLWQEMLQSLFSTGYIPLRLKCSEIYVQKMGLMLPMIRVIISHYIACLECWPNIMLNILWYSQSSL